MQSLLHGSSTATSVLTAKLPKHLPGIEAPDMADHGDLDRENDLLKMQLEACVDDGRMLEHNYLNLKHRYHSLPIEVRESDVLHSDTRRTLCAVELGNNSPWSQMPQMVAFLQETSRVVLVSLEDDTLVVGAYFGLRLFRETFQYAEILLQSLMEAIEEYERANETVNLQYRVNNFVASLRQFDIVKERLQSQWEGLIRPVREMSLVDKSVHRVCEVEFGSARFSQSPYKGLKQKLDHIAVQIVGVATAGDVEVAKRHLDVGEGRVAALEQYLRHLETAVDAHVEVERRFFDWVKAVSVSPQEAPAVPTEPGEVVLQARFRVAIRETGNNDAVGKTVDAQPEFSANVDFRYPSPRLTPIKHRFDPPRPILQEHKHTVPPPLPARRMRSPTLQHPRPVSYSPRTSIEKWTYEVLETT